MSHLHLFSRKKNSWIECESHFHERTKSTQAYIQRLSSIVLTTTLECLGRSPELLYHLYQFFFVEVFTYLHGSDPVVPLFYLVLSSNKSNIVRYSFDFLITKLGINNFYQGIRRSIYIYFLTSQQVKLIQLFSFFLMRTSCWREKWEFPRKFNSIHSKVEEFLFWKTHDWTSKFKIKTTITITDNIKHHHTDGSRCSLKKID